MQRELLELRLCTYTCNMSRLMLCSLHVVYVLALVCMVGLLSTATATVSTSALQCSWCRVVSISILKVCIYHCASHAPRGVTTAFLKLECTFNGHCDTVLYTR
jgi:hypothetical protein